MNEMDHAIDLSLLHDFQENKAGARELLFLRLAEMLQSGDLHKHPEIRDWLAKSFESIAEGDDLSPAFGFPQGQPQATFQVWARPMCEMAILRALSDLTLQGIRSLVMDRLPTFGQALSDESLRRYWRLHGRRVPINIDNVHEYLVWINGHYETPCGFRSSELGAHAERFEAELFRRVKK